VSEADGKNEHLNVPVVYFALDDPACISPGNDRPWREASRVESLGDVRREGPSWRLTSIRFGFFSLKEGI
jgi:hypothetical protein